MNCGSELGIIRELAGSTDKGTGVGIVTCEASGESSKCQHRIDDKEQSKGPGAYFVIFVIER